MEHYLFDKLRNYRLCLPQNSSFINLYDNETIICKCDILEKIKHENYRHAALICLYNTDNIISHGINKYKNKPMLSIHAEKACIDNLPILYKKKKKVSIDMYIGRFGINNNILMSKPCISCLINMNKLIPDRGYKLIDVYYTGDNNDIIKTNIKDLNKQEMYLTKAMRNKKIC